MKQSNLPLTKTQIWQSNGQTIVGHNQNDGNTQSEAHMIEKLRMNEKMSNGK